MAALLPSDLSIIASSPSPPLPPHIIYACVWCTCAHRERMREREARERERQREGDRERQVRLYNPRTMYLAAGQRYQPNKPGYCPSYLPCVLYQIPGCTSASAGRVPILKFHSDRKGGEKGGQCQGQRGHERIAERTIYSNRWFMPPSDDDRTFPPANDHLCSDSRRSRGGPAAIVRFNSLFLLSSVAGIRGARTVDLRRAL